MNIELLQELNENIKKLMAPKKESKSDTDKIEEYENRILNKYAKKNLKTISQ